MVVCQGKVGAKQNWSQTAKCRNLATPYPASGTHVGVIWTLNVLGRSLEKFCQLQQISLSLDWINTEMVAFFFFRCSWSWHLQFLFSLLELRLHGYNSKLMCSGISYKRSNNVSYYLISTSFCNYDEETCGSVNNDSFMISGLDPRVRIYQTLLVDKDESRSPSPTSLQLLCADIETIKSLHYSFQKA